MRDYAIVAENGEDIESGIGVLNPFRYRGYYYDTETELYFLQTRYYDPEVGRFISRDSIEYADLNFKQYKIGPFHLKYFL